MKTMTYRIDTSPSAGARWGQEREATIVLVGCGGTGGFLAEAICRLLLDHNAQLYLVDPDRVEPHNVARQCFDRGDVNRFKVEVLAERLSRRFGREVGYSVHPFDRELHTQVFGDARGRVNLLIGCVDNSRARRAIAAALDLQAGATATRATGPGGWIPATDGTAARCCWGMPRARRGCVGRSSRLTGSVGPCRPRACSALIFWTRHPSRAHKLTAPRP